MGSHGEGDGGSFCSLPSTSFLTAFYASLAKFLTVGHNDRPAAFYSDLAAWNFSNSTARRDAVGRIRHIRGSTFAPRASV